MPLAQFLPGPIWGTRAVHAVMGCPWHPLPRHSGIAIKHAVRRRHTLRPLAPPDGLCNAETPGRHRATCSSTHKVMVCPRRQCTIVKKCLPALPNPKFTFGPSICSERKCGSVSHCKQVARLAQYRRFACHRLQPDRLAVPVPATQYQVS